MRIWLIISTIFLIMSSTSAEEVPSIMQLTTINFQQQFGCSLYEFETCNTSFNMEWFVMFMAPWCGHCRVAKPEFQDFNDILQMGAIPDKINHIRQQEGLSLLSDQAIKALIVNCDNQAELCRQFGVRGYPTFIYITSDKKAIRYKGKRTAQSFVNFTLFHDPNRYSFGEYVPLSHNFWTDLSEEFIIYVKSYWHLIIIFGIAGPSVLGYYIGSWMFGPKYQEPHSQKSNQDKKERSEENKEPLRNQENKEAQNKTDKAKVQ